MNMCVSKSHRTRQLWKVSSIFMTGLWFNLPNFCVSLLCTLVFSFSNILVDFCVRTGKLLITVKLWTFVKKTRRLSHFLSYLHLHWIWLDLQKFNMCTIVCLWCINISKIFLKVCVYKCQIKNWFLLIHFVLSQPPSLTYQKQISSSLEFIKLKRL